jgi:hypothetical protein
MRNTRTLVSIAMLVAVVAFSVSLTRIPTAAAQGTSHETTPVYYTPDGFLLGAPVPGAFADFSRSQNGITTNVHTFATQAGAYTLWWVVFNQPQNCQTYLCTFDEPDLVIGATGHPVSASEVANFSARLSVGGPYNNEIIYEGPDPALTNPGGALITLVVRYHGTELARGGSNSFRTFLAGCPDDGAPCEDVQLVVSPGECSGACLVPFP